MSSKKTLPNDDEDQETAEEIADATDETPTDVTAPEVSDQTKDLTEWNDAPASHGTAAPKVTHDDEDDEDSIAAKLVYEGSDEADREQRLASADPDYEP